MLIDLFDRVIQATASNEGSVTHPVPVRQQSMHLHLPEAGVEAFKNAIQRYPLPAKSRVAFVQLYLKACKRASAISQQTFQEAATGLSLHGGEKLLDSSRRAFELRHSENIRALQNHIFSIIEKRLSSTTADNSSDTDACTSSSSDIDGDIKRPHRATAVSLLELAFEHSPTITQAEKYRLAEITGLDPRQVTIWVRSPPPL